MLDIFTDFNRLFAAASPMPAKPRAVHVHEPREDFDWDGAGRLLPIATCQCGAEAAFRCSACGEWVFEDDPSPDIKTCIGCYRQAEANKAVDDDLVAIQAETPHHDAPVELTEAQLERMRETEGAL